MIRTADNYGTDSTPFGCGPDALIDQSLTLGWSTAKPASGGKFATIKLLQAVDISSLQVDPSGTCGDDIVASAGQYKIETSIGPTCTRPGSAALSCRRPGSDRPAPHSGAARP